MGKVKTPTVIDIPFDPIARREYLTGFHKRKQARVRVAQEAAARHEKEQKTQERRELREQRKRKLQERIEAVAKATRWTGVPQDSPTEEETIRDESHHSDEQESTSESEAHDRKTDQYMDEAKHTIVAVEAMDLDVKSSSEEDRGGGEGLNSGAGDRLNAGEDKPKQRRRPKVNKKKFRYLTKIERKLDRVKLKARKVKEGEKWKAIRKERPTKKSR